MSWLSSILGNIIHPGQATADAANQQTKMMEQQQQAHDAAVAQGKSSIDSAFSQFTPDYYSGVTKAYENAYDPQLTDQYNVAKDQLTSLLAGNDTLESTGGANALAQLQKTYNTNQGQIANQAQDAANQQKVKVDNTKSGLYGMNANAADPLAAASQAQAQAGSIVSPSAYPSLGNVFASVLSPLSSAAKSNSQSMNPLLGGAAPAGPGAANPTGNGSAVFG